MNSTSDIILECPGKEACLGYDENGALIKGANRKLAISATIEDDYCAYGHTGNLCSKCIEGFGIGKASGSREICVECSGNYSAIINLFLGFLLAIALISISIFYSI